MFGLREGILMLAFPKGMMVASAIRDGVLQRVLFPTWCANTYVRVGARLRVTYLSEHTSVTVMDNAGIGRGPRPLVVICELAR